MNKQLLTYWLPVELLVTSHVFVAECNGKYLEFNPSESVLQIV
jgi:hypothetical protein